MSEAAQLRCSHCGRGETADEALLRCSGCDLVWYCGLEHQTYDWKKHKPLCRSVQGQRREAHRLRERPAAPADEAALQNAPSFQSLPIPIDSGPSSSLEAGPSGSGLSFFPPPKRARIEPQGSLPPAEKLGGNLDHALNRPYKVSVEQHLQSCLTSHPELSRYHAFCSRVNEISAHVLASLNKYGWAAVDNFLGLAHADAILGEVKELYASQKFADGQLMKSTRKGVSVTNVAAAAAATNAEVRSDFILWFDNTTPEGTKAVNINFLLSMVDSVVVQVGSGLPDCSVKGRSRAMVAVYPGNGSRYVRHVDNPVEDGRVVTAIYYLNKDWSLCNGGSLRLYPTSAKESVDIQPLFDRLFFFWSDKRNPHEVLPVHNHRFAITTWYFDEDEKKRALERVAARERRRSEKKAAAAAAATIAAYKSTSLPLSIPVPNHNLI